MFYTIKKFKKVTALICFFAMALQLLAGLIPAGADTPEPASLASFQQATQSEPDIIAPESTLYLTSSQPGERVSVDIGGSWKFYKGTRSGAEAAGYNDSSWQTVSIPHTWNAEDGSDGDGAYYKGDGWYRKTVLWDPSFAGKQLYLEFLGANTLTTLYINGQQVGSTHTGGYNAFRYDITDHLIPGTDNVIAVKVNNSITGAVAPKNGDFTFWGGIYRGISIIATGKVHVDMEDNGSYGMFLTPQKQGDTDTWKLGVKTKIVNDAAEEKTVTVRATLREPETFEAIEEIPADKTPFDEETMYGTTVFATFEQEITIPAGQSADINNDSMTINNPRLWQGRTDPYRYQVTLEVIENGEPVDILKDKIGFRTFSVNKATGFYLNGVSYPIRGLSRHQDKEGKGSAISNKDHDIDMGMIYDIGATGMRFVHYPQTYYFYELCDRYGIVLWSEIPLVGGVGIGGTGSYSSPDATRAEFIRSTKSQLVEMIRQHYNRAGICFWGLENEIGADLDSVARPFLSDLNDLAHQEDPSRLTTQATNNSTGATWASDLIAWNTYPGWYNNGKLSLSIPNLIANPTRPVGLSEYGAGANPYHHELYPEKPPYTTINWHPEEYQALIHEDAVRGIDPNVNPGLWGAFAWLMFDLGSENRNEGGMPGINNKGVVTYDREIKKDAYYIYKANWSNDPFVHITSRRFNPRDKTETYIKIYSNCDSVTLTLNGTEIGTKVKEAGDPNTNYGIYQWDTITLSDGENTVLATGQKDGQQYSETIVWNKVLSYNTDITSGTLAVDNAAKTIGLIGTTTADEFYSLLQSSNNATFALFEADGITPVSGSAKVNTTMLLVVTAEDTTTIATYQLYASHIVARIIPTVTSTQTGSLAEYTTDGDYNTTWVASNKNYPQEITFDLGNLYCLNTIKTYWDTKDGRYYKYTVSASKDGMTYTDIVDGTKNKTSGMVSDSMNEKWGRYVKITATGCSSENGFASIDEVELYGWRMASSEYAIDHRRKTIRIPELTEELPTEDFLSNLDIEGNCGTALNSPSYYIVPGDTFEITDYQEGVSTYTITVGPEVIYRNELQAKITAANELYQLASANIGDMPGEYPQAVVTALSAGIAAAEAVLNNQAAAQEEIDTATDDLSAVMAQVLVNPPTPPPEPTTPREDIYSNNFESFATSQELAASGWTHSTGSLGNITLGTSSTKFAQIQSGAANGYGQFVFDPIALNENGGFGMGRNLKLIAEYRISRQNFNSGNTVWASFTDSAKAARSETVGAGSRMDTTPHATNSALFRYASYIASSSQTHANLYTAPSGANTIAENNIWVKIRYEVSITDAQGEFLPAPTVDIYVNDGSAPVVTGAALLSESDKIDAIRIGSSSSTGTIAIDDINVYVTRTVFVPTFPPPSIPVANLALNKPVTASFEEAGREAIYAVDGSLSTRWTTYGSSQLPALLQIDLGETRNIYQFKTHWYKEPYVYEYDIYVTDEAAMEGTALKPGLTPVAAGLIGYGGGGTQYTLHNLENMVQGRYVTLACKNRAAQAYEMEVLGTDINGNTPTPAPTPTPVPVTLPPAVTPPPPPPGTPEGTTYLYIEDFEKYADSVALRQSGWMHTYSISNLTLVGNLETNYANIRTGAKDAYAQLLFTPVALTAAGGPSPGRNAKLVAEYKIARHLFSSGNAAWASFTDSSKLSRAETVGAGTRMDSTPHVSNTSLFRYASYMNSNVSAVPALYTAPSGVNTSAENGIWVKFKYVISITNELGEYLSSPTVDIYTDDSETPVLSGAALLTPSDKIDAVRIGSSSSASGLGIDDIKVYTVVDAGEWTPPTPTPEPTPTPTPAPADKTALAAKIDEATALFATANANIGTEPGKYDASVVSALSSAISSAQAVYDDAAATQQQTDTAVLSLQSAITICTPITPTPQPVTPTPAPTPTVAPTTAPTAAPTVSPTATPDPTVAPTAAPPGDITPVHEDNFNSYTNDYNFRTTAGWTHSVAMDKFKILTSGDLKYLQVQSSAANGYGQKTFAPVPLNANGGASPGANAKLVAEYRLARNASDLNIAIWAAFTDSSLAVGSETVSAVTRRVSNTATPLFKYGTSSADSAHDANDLYTDLVNGNTAAANAQFVKIRYEITLTDAAGTFVSTPAVDIYVNDSSEPVISGAPLLNTSDKIDAIRVAGQVANSKMLLDDINVYIQRSSQSATEAPTTTEDPGPTPVPADKSGLETAISDASALYSAANANVGTNPGQFDAALVSALISAITNAESVYENPDATQQEVDAALASLQTATGACVPYPPTPTPEPSYLVSSDEHIVIDQQARKISYPHYKIGTVSYHSLSVFRSKLSAAQDYIFELYQADGITAATAMEPTNKVVVSSGGSAVATYTLSSANLYGDVNGDGTLTASDLGLIKKYLMSKASYPFIKPYGPLAADINKTLTGTNTVTASDLGILKKYLMSKISYPIGGALEFVYDPQ